MQKVVSQTPIILGGLYLLTPILTFIAFALGYDYFNYFSDWIFSLFLLIISVFITVLLVWEKVKLNKFNKIIIYILPLLSFVNIFFFLINKAVFFEIFLMGTVISSLVLFCFKIKNFTIKIITVLVYLLISIPISFMCLLNFIFFDFERDKVVKSANSPNGKYIAKIIDDDQGALGGNTYVYVYDKDSDVNLYLFKLTQNPEIMYEGKWGEFENMSIVWKDNKTLLINEKEYKVKTRY